MNRGTGASRGRANATSRPSKASYRRRRLVVGLLALVLVALVALAGTLGVRALLERFGPGEGPTATEPATDAATTPAPEATPDEEALANPVGCVPQAIDVVTALDSTQVSAGSDVPASVTVTNRGQVPCLLDVGHAALQMTVTSGEDQVWTSVECPAGSSEIPILLDIGAEEQRTLTWSGRRSAEGCPGDTAMAEAGTYVLEVALTVGESRVATEQALTLR
ncbi:hypothetical protein IM660_15710 [Ruania alkalisoli]|uniref:DUF4232 domain-containing protein n=1 Tax=Ruania alkalisoli TaxID=2779775 RepID=A0A7M1SR76_9MICO|nr:hypothetical protein [Ruania alkalisoli]QOR70060.1 hypothetical protein IM660_15710 [Ruania alkalisoli]